MLKGSKQPWTAASGLFLYADESNNYKHDHANKVFKQSLRSENQLVKKMPIRKMLHASFFAHVCHVRCEPIKASLNWVRDASRVSVGDESEVLFRSEQDRHMSLSWPIRIQNLWGKQNVWKAPSVWCRNCGNSTVSVELCTC